MAKWKSPRGEGPIDWFWSHNYADFPEKGKPSPFDKLKPDAKLDWWKNKNVMPYQYNTPNKKGIPLPPSQGGPILPEEYLRDPEGFMKKKWGPMMDDMRDQFKKAKGKLSTPTDADMERLGKQLKKFFDNDMKGKIQEIQSDVFNSKDVSGKFRQNIYNKGISPYSTGAPTNRMEFYDTGSQYGREMQGARESTFADDFAGMMKKVPKKPFNWKGVAKTVGKNILKHGPRMLAEGLAVGAVDMTAGAIGKHWVGPTPLFTDPDMTYDQYYEDAFRRKLEWDRENRPPVQDTEYPRPSLSAL